MPDCNSMLEMMGTAWVWIEYADIDLIVQDAWSDSIQSVSLMEEYGTWSAQSLHRGSEVITKSLQLQGVKLVFEIWYIKIFDPTSW